jgi:hypothetical protein
MTQATQILELLESISPDGRCDDCLANELGISPRQSVNGICRHLRDHGQLTRIRAACSLCSKPKLVNTLASVSSYQTVAPRANAAKAKATSPGIDVEKLRTDVVRMCRTVWQQSQTGTPPRSISALINELRQHGALPNHMANLMLTLCNLRNVNVYENVELGEHELAIASHCASVLGDWWSRRTKTA